MLDKVYSARSIQFAMVIYRICDNIYDTRVLTINISLNIMLQIFDNLVEIQS